MVRFSSLLGAAFAVMSLSATALSADYLSGSDELRGSYPEEWGFPNEPDPLDFEVGLRYWYSLGSHQLTAFGGNYTSADRSSILEAHARINDNSTASYLKANIGYAATISGEYSTPSTGGLQAMSGGYIGYAGADLGMQAFGNDQLQVGGFVGYQYLADNPDMGRATFMTSTGGGDSQTNQTEIHSLRLGISAHMDINDKLDFNIEAAVIPYAKISGRYGAMYFPDFAVGADTYTQGSSGTLDGRGYGASGEAMIGFHPTENLTLRVGGRAWYLTGEATMQFTARDNAAPGTEQNYISNISGLEFFRFGALAELTGRF